MQSTVNDRLRAEFLGRGVEELSPNDRLRAEFLGGEQSIGLGEGVARRFARGAIGTHGATLRTGETITTGQRSYMDALFDAVGIEPDSWMRVAAKEFTPSPGDVLLPGGVGDAVSATASLAGRELQGFAQDIEQREPEGTGEKIALGVAEAAGSAVPFMFASAAGGPLAASALGASVSASDLQDEALARGASPGRVAAATALGAGIGAAEGLPWGAVAQKLGLGKVAVPSLERTFQRLGQILVGGNREAARGVSASVARTMMVQGAGELLEETAQDQLQLAVSNWVLQSPEQRQNLQTFLRTIPNTMLEQGVPAGIVGALLGGTATAMQQLAPRGAEDGAAAKTNSGAAPGGAPAESGGAPAGPGAAPPSLASVVSPDMPGGEVGEPVVEAQPQLAAGGDASGAPVEVEAPPLEAAGDATADVDTPSDAPLASPMQPVLAPPRGVSVSSPPASAANTARYTADYAPLEQEAGAFRRASEDTRRAIARNLTRARAERDGAKAGEGDSVFRIIEDVARRFALGTPGVGRARLLKKWAAGFYRPAGEEIRLRRRSYVRTFLHEVGHHLHKAMFARATRAGGQRASRSISANDFPAHWRPELELLGRDLYGARRPTGGYATEGWAETVHFLFADPQHLKRRAPRLYRDVVSTLVREQPDVWMVLQEARQRLKNVLVASEQNPVRQFVQYRGREKSSVRSLWDRFYGTWFDNTQRLKTFEEDLGLDELGAARSPQVAAKRVTGHIADDVARALEKGTWDPGDVRKGKTGKSLREILEPVRADLETWQDYMVAKRVLEKRAQGLDALPGEPRLKEMTSSDTLRKFIERVEAANPAFAEASREFQEFNRWLVSEYAVEMGLLTPEAAELILEKNKDYITFSHVRPNDAVAHRGGTPRKVGDRGSGFRRFREGLGEPLHPPLESFVEHMRSVMANARLNQVAQRITDPVASQRSGIGRWIAKVERPLEANKVRGADLARVVQEQLGIQILPSGQLIVPSYLSGVDPAVVEELVQAVAAMESATFFKPGNRIDKKNRELTVLRNGAPEWFEVKDDQLFELMEGLHSPAAAQGWATLMRWASLPARTLRAGATTKNPGFFIGNFLADLTQALTFSKTNPLTTIPARLAGMRDAFTGGRWLDLFEASGASTANLFAEYRDARTGKINLDAMFAEPRAFGLVKGDTAGAVARDLLSLGAIERLGNKFELANRVGAFAAEHTTKQRGGAFPDESLTAGGEEGATITLDYTRGGAWAREINRVVPFFNAALQGVDKLATEIKRRPVRSLGRITAFVILPSLVSMLLNWNDDEYWALPFRDRDRYWYFPNGYDDDGKRMWVRVKKPYGLGIFAIATERSIAQQFGINPATGERGGDPEAAHGMAMAMVNELRPTFNIAGVQPLLELAAGDRGWSMYRDNYIVPATDVELPVEQQGTGRSSPTARFLGTMLDQPPAKVDYAIEGFFGGLGRDVTSAAIDPAVRAATGEERREPLEFADWLIVRRFLARAPRSNHQAISRFYDQYEELRTIDKGFDALKKTDTDAAERYYGEHSAELALYAGYERVRAQMSKHFAELRRIYRDDSIEPDEAAQQIDEQYTAIIDLAQSANRAGESIKDETNEPLASAQR